MKNMILRGNNCNEIALTNALEDFFHDVWLPTRSTEKNAFRVDLRADENRYTVDADLPGVKKEDVKISLSEDLLTITVEKNEETKEEKDNYLHRERREFISKRIIRLPEADAEGIEAKLNDGVLTILIPKQKKAEPTRNIEIQ